MPHLTLFIATLQIAMLSKRAVKPWALAPEIEGAFPFKVAWEVGHS
jgi:hypothetical protein